MEPKRLRFSDFSSDDSSIAGWTGSHSRASLASADLVVRFSTSLATVSTESIPSIAENRDTNADFLIPAAPSRRSMSSGTTVWTAQGSTRSAASTETTEVGRGASRSSVETVATIDNDEMANNPALAVIPSGTGTPARRVSLDNNTTPTSCSPALPVAIADDTEEMPPTQPSGPLKGVVAYVEVYGDEDNRSAAVGYIMRGLGAVICRRFTNKVTHVVYRDGKRTTLEKARLRNVYLVTVSWIDACKRENEKVPESGFAIPRSEHGTPQTLWRSRRRRSMRITPSEVELMLTDEWFRKRQKRLEAARLKREAIKDLREGRLAGVSRPATSDKRTAETEQVTPARENPIRSTTSRAHSGNITDGDDTPDSLRKQVAHVKKILDVTTDSCANEPALEEEEEEESLADTVRRKLYGVGGPLHGSPIPYFLNRSRSATTSAQKRLENSNADNSEASRAPVRHCLAQVNTNGKETSSSSKADRGSDKREKMTRIEEIVTMVCEKVRGVDLAGTALSQSTRRRIFEADRDRLSDRMDPAGEKPVDAAAGADNTSTSEAIVVDRAFGLQPAAKIGDARKRKAKRQNEESMIRLRSSLFQMNTSSELVRQLQTGRRSSEDFEDLPAAEKKKAVSKASKKPRGKPGVRASARKRKGRRPAPTRVIAMTNLQQDDRDVVRSIVKRLRGFRVGDKVTTDTTHVVCGENRRTLNVLLGVARGCWMLPLDWVYRSLAHGDWLNEEEFELTDQYPAAKVIRKRKVSCSADWDLVAVCHLFTGTGPFYVCHQSKPPALDMRMLIRWCGGKIALTSRRAKYCVGCKATEEGAVGVRETWILDCIMQQKILPLDEYAIV